MIANGTTKQERPPDAPHRDVDRLSLRPSSRPQGGDILVNGTTSSATAGISPVSPPGNGAFYTPKSAAARIVATELSLLCNATCPRPDNTPVLKYGTAGFRSKAEDLEVCMFRVGVLAALRSVALGGRATGLMVTASHNPINDNGVKIIEPTGDMLPTRYEDMATALSNAAEGAQLTAELARILESEEGLAQQVLDLLQANHTVSGAGAGRSPPTGNLFSEMRIEGISKACVARSVSQKGGLVFIGRDTRPSSDKLAMAAVAGVSVVAGLARAVGVCTTPHLHFIVKCHNAPEYGVGLHFIVQCHNTYKEVNLLEVHSSVLRLPRWSDTPPNWQRRIIASSISPT